jgi:hypothetical protein
MRQASVYLPTVFHIEPEISAPIAEIFHRLLTWLILSIKRILKTSINALSVQFKIFIYTTKF